MEENSEIPVGTLYVEQNIRHKPKWMSEAAISVGVQTLNRYRGFDGFLTMSETRDGDFSLILGFRKPEPYLALFVGIPGPNKIPIIQQIYLKA